MTITAPKPLQILDYKIFFNEDPPENIISFVTHISKEHLLYQIVALNSRLKPSKEVNISTTFETQDRELKYFTRTNELYIKYSSIIEKQKFNKNDSPVVFDRQACLYAIEEIINSTEIHIVENFNIDKVEVWESILKYLLAVNYSITKTNVEPDENNSIFETLNSILLPLNEQVIESDPIFTLYRGYWLIDYFLNLADFRNELLNYFKEKYDIEPQNFILQILKINIDYSNKKDNLKCFFKVEESKHNLFEKLSVLTPNKDIHKLISIRKSPFINVGKLKYLLIDNSILLEKSYSQLLNDFWFDKIKNVKDSQGNNKFTIQHYRSVFGKFFEYYLSKILKKSFENYKYSTLLMFDELKIYPDKKPIELADVYLRYNNKILLGQVKSGSIYDTEKYGGSLNALYKNDRDKFFSDFGVNQVIDSLTRINKFIYSLDKKFPTGHCCEIYPCIIINDNALQTPLMADIFNRRFQELLKNVSIKKFRIKPLSLIHINDFERLEDSLSKNPKEIWNLLKYNHRDIKYTPPFYNTVNRMLKDGKSPLRIIELYKSLLQIYKF